MPNPPRVEFVLPDGTVVVGVKAAQAALGNITRQRVYQRCTGLDAQARWIVAPARPPHRTRRETWQEAA